MTWPRALEVATVAAKLEAVEVQYVGDRVVEEARVVRDDDWNKRLETKMASAITAVYVLDVQCVRLVR